MLLPRDGGLHHRLATGVDRRTPTPLERQTAPRLPPGRAQVQPAGLRRPAPPLPLGPGDPGRWRLPRAMGAQVAGAPHPRAGGSGLQPLGQARDDACALAPGAPAGGGPAGRGLEGPPPPHAPAAAVVRGHGGPARALVPDRARRGLGAHRAQRLAADDPPRRDRRWGRLEAGPLVSTAGHQRCWRVHTQPSAWSPCQIGPWVTCRPGRAWRARCRRARGQSATGDPRRRGVVRASARTRPRAVASGRRGRPGRAASAKPARPWRCNRGLQARPRKAERPTERAMAGAFRPWARAPMSRARGPCRWGAVRAWASRVSAGASAPVHVRPLTARRLPPHRVEREWSMREEKDH
jgi:hypothetical protein